MPCVVDFVVLFVQKIDVREESGTQAIINQSERARGNFLLAPEAQFL